MRSLMSELSLNQMGELANMIESMTLWDQLPNAPDRRMSFDSLHSNQEPTTLHNSFFLPTRGSHDLIVDKGIIWDHTRWIDENDSEQGSIEEEEDEEANKEPQDEMVVQSPVTWMSSDSDSSSDDESIIIHTSKPSNLVHSPKSTNLVDLAKEASETSPPFLKELGAYAIEGPNEPVEFQTHPHQLHQALTEALKTEYSGNDGTIWIHYARRALGNLTAPPGTPCITVPSHSDRRAFALEQATKETDYMSNDGQIWIHHARPRIITNLPTPQATRSTTPVTPSPIFGKGSFKSQFYTLEEYERICRYMREQETIAIRREAMKARREREPRFFGGPLEADELRDGMFRMTPIKRN